MPLKMAKAVQSIIHMEPLYSGIGAAMPEEPPYTSCVSNLGMSKQGKIIFGPNLGPPCAQNTIGEDNKAVMMTTS